MFSSFFGFTAMFKTLSLKCVIKDLPSRVKYIQYLFIACLRSWLQQYTRDKSAKCELGAVLKLHVAAWLLDTREMPA